MIFTRFIKPTILGVLICLALTGSAQEPPPLVELIRDSRVDELTKKQYALNKNANNVSELSRYKTSNGKYKGYRIMVLNTNNRELAYQTRGQLATRFPQHSLYLGYQAPYYKLKMGDFLEKSDAEALKKQLSGIIKQGLFIIPDAINLKPEEEERLIEKITKEKSE
ncbi:MAG: SPOR domain-containing protein [Chitinophagaceae bacterium]|jgi:hypothetical protein|nr:SPOR domain-containing protein [Chitinophagaceae bacterium]MCU0405167.1 SPOR domain-containing protein [Chitinophagaceae bacterium]